MTTLALAAEALADRAERLGLRLPAATLGRLASVVIADLQACRYSVDHSPAPRRYAADAFESWDGVLVGLAVMA